MKKQESHPYIIVIGTSAGGFPALYELVSQLSPELNVPVFIVIHLGKNSMAELIIYQLQKYTRLTCVIPEHNREIQKNHIYLAPADRHLIIKKNKIILGQGVSENKFKPSVNVLFRSAAVAYSTGVIGIVLTGMLDDGAAGMLAIKKCGGVCIVQEPGEAEFPGMPLSVLNTMEVDYCLPLKEMGYALTNIIRTRKPKRIKIPVEVEMEAEIAERVYTGFNKVTELGNKSIYSCPDCGGGLWEMKDKTLHRYRCHIGHAYTEKQLLSRQAETLESTLWVALRMMEERKAMYGNLGRPESKKALQRSATSLGERTKEIDLQINNLKELLFDIQKNKDFHEEAISSGHNFLIQPSAT